MKTIFGLPSDCEVLITRTFNARRERVWEMWTTAEHLKQWWGPEGWSLPVCELDFRVGGTWFYCMEGPNDMTSCGRTTYLEIDAPTRLVHSDAFADAEGNLLDAFPIAHISVQFLDEGDSTTVRSTVGYDSKEQRDTIVEMGMKAEIDQTLNRLEAYLQTLA